MPAPAIIGCCAPFTLTAGVVLCAFALLMFRKSWTFEVIAAKQDWDLGEKAACCRNAAIFYVILSLLLWLWLGLGTMLGKRGHRRCCGWPFSRSSDLTDPDMEGDDGRSNGSESKQFSEAAPLLPSASP